MSKTAPIPKHTFGEAVIVNGETFYFDVGKIYHIPCEVNEYFIPFKHSCGNGNFVAIATLPFTLATTRKAIISQVKHLANIGTKWDRRTTTKSKDGGKK